MGLYEILSRFKRHSSEVELTAAFAELAPHFIYGGYIKVNDAYRVYIRSVGPYEEPYLPLMSVYVHSSGFDITFENGEQGYRASALIREYSVYDEGQGRFIPLTPKGALRDERVSWLKYFLNGFPLDGRPGIVWVDEARCQRRPLVQCRRLRTYVVKDGMRTRDTRLWRFRDDDELCLPTG